MPCAGKCVYISDMELIDAIKARHSVRKYSDKPIVVTKVAELRATVERINADTGLNIHRTFSKVILQT